LEGEWGACLTFSNTTFDELLFYITAIMFETYMVFCSKNITLLTSTLLTLMALIKPFKYPHPQLFNLPENLFTLLDSPVPLLIGVNLSL